MGGGIGKKASREPKLASLVTGRILLKRPSGNHVFPANTP